MRGLRKAEELDVLWEGITIEDFLDRVDAYIHWYNGERIRMSLGGLIPLELRSKKNYRLSPRNRPHAHLGISS